MIQIKTHIYKFVVGRFNNTYTTYTNIFLQFIHGSGITGIAY